MEIIQEMAEQNFVVVQEFGTWATGKGLDARTLAQMEQEDLANFEALRAVHKDDLAKLSLTIGMRVLLQKAARTLKDHSELRDLVEVMTFDFATWLEESHLTQTTTEEIAKEDLDRWDTMLFVDRKDLCSLPLTIGQRALLLKAVAALPGRIDLCTTSILSLATGSRAANKVQTRQLRSEPTSMSLVHSQLWTCHYYGIAIHPVGDLAMLEEDSFIAPLVDGVATHDFKDVTAVGEDYAVACKQGLFIFNMAGDLLHTVEKGTLHWSVTFYREKIYAVMESDVIPNGAVIEYIFNEECNSWQRSKVMYLAAPCLHTNNMRVLVNDDRIYVSNTTNSTLLVLSLEGQLIREYPNRASSFMCSVDDSALLEAQYTTTRLNILSKSGRWYENVVTTLDGNVKGAVLCNGKLYVTVVCDAQVTYVSKPASYLQLYSLA